jgi:hypothetical protein
MVALACGLLALGVAAFLLSPLLDQQRRWFGGQSELEDLNKQKDFLYSAIRELTIDHKMGKLSDQDHEELESEYMTRASTVLDQLEHAANGKHSLSDRVEQAVLEIRRNRGGSPKTAPESLSDEAEQIPEIQDSEESNVASDLPDGKPIDCTKCGKENEAAAKFCIECGTSLGVSSCEECGNDNPFEAKFCAGCGTEL